MATVELYAKHVKFGELKRAIEGVLADVDQGRYDEELRTAGVTRPADVKVAQGIRVEQKQYLTPEEWFQITVIFGPLAAHIAKDVWDIIVVPKLKRLFRDDQIQTLPPKDDRKG